MKCPHCGKEIADGSKFCEFCGREVRPAKKESPRQTNWKAIAIGMMSALCVIGIYAWYTSSRPENNQQESIEQMDPVVQTEPTEQTTPVVQPQPAQQTQSVSTTTASEERESLLVMTGTVDGNRCTFRYDFETGRGRFVQYLSNGNETVRTLKLNYYEDGYLVLDACDTKGHQVSTFAGNLSSNNRRYSGRITNNKGGSVDFSFSR